MCGMLASVAVMTWIVAGAQVAIYNDKLLFDEKPVSIAGCPANTTFRSPVDYSGLVSTKFALFLLASMH